MLLPKSFVQDAHRRSTQWYSPKTWRVPFFLTVAILISLCSYTYFSEPNDMFESRMMSRKKSTNPTGHKKDCSSKNFKTETLKAVMEFSFNSLFLHQGISEYEASDVVMMQGSSEAFVVFDDLFSIARLRHPQSSRDSNTIVGSPLRPQAPSSLLKWSGDTSGESEFEFIAYNESAQVYLVGQESVSQDDGSHRAVTYDVTFSETTAVVGTRCVADFVFSHSNKGFEGAIIVTTKEGTSLLVGLCEGNYCAGDEKGRKAGNGRLVVMKRVMQDGACIYETVDVVNLPSEVAFEDYSAIAIWNETTVAIASQQNSAIFIGELDLDDGVKVTGERIVDFPRNDNCEIKYCNVEGIAFANENTIISVSDSMKSKGKQNFRCREKDESMAVFQLT